MIERSAEFRLAMCGLGAWGRNVARAFASIRDAKIELICDANPDQAREEAAKYDGAQLTADYKEVLDSGVQAVILATPAPLHFEMAREALNAGKHVFVEKPMTLRASDAAELVRLAAERNLVLMVGHLLEYHPAVEAIGRMIAAGEIGDLYYMHTVRVNLGVVRSDENALWSLAPHDFSVILHLFGEDPDSVSARGQSYLQPGIEDVVFVNLHFPAGRMAQVHVSWLDPRKERRMVIIGSKKMVEFDDMQPAEKIKVYDKGAEVKRGTTADMIGAIRVRHGDVHIPRLPPTEPLAAEARHFVDCIRTGATPRSDGRDGLRVVRLLEAATESLQCGGEPVPVAAR